MSTPKKLVPVAGSERSAMRGSRAVGAVDPQEHISVTLRLRPRGQADSLRHTVRMLAEQPHGERKHLTHEEYEQAHGADPADLARVADFAKANGLKVEESSPSRRSVRLSGTVASLSQAFGVTLQTFEHSGRSFRGRTGPVHVPAELAPIVQGVFGLDNRPWGKPHFRVMKPMPAGALAAHAMPMAFQPPELGKIYRFPNGATGKGQCIAIIEMGGGFRADELKNYFEKIIKQPAPQVGVVSVDGGQNQPDGDPSGPDGEVLLDIEVAGALAPGARIVVYFAPNTDQGFLDAITTAVHDTQNKPSVISLSWGSPEERNTDQGREQVNQALQAAAALGITVCVSSGDNGSADFRADDPAWDGQAHVDFPASSPYALGCGGTHLVVKESTIIDEEVWNNGPNDGSGGGVSRFFDLPDYQASAQVPPAKNPEGPARRGVPDVSGDADPSTGYIVLVDGQPMTIGGTSAVSPLWAALVAILNEKLGNRAGFLNPILYANPKIFSDVTSGTNGDYTAGPGWDPCTGLGSPNGIKLLEVLRSPALVS